MTKQEKLNSAKQIAALLINTLKEIKLTNDEELQALFLALEVSDVEQIEDAKIYCLSCDQQENSYYLNRVIEDLESAAKDLFKIKL